MRLIILIFALIQLSLANSIAEEQEHRAANICYTGYGCFTTAPPFWDLVLRPFAELPESPQKIATKFFLYTRHNQEKPTEIKANNPSCYFGAHRKTRIIVHGFLHNGEKPWIMNMKNALLQVEDSNVIVVDWSKGNGYPYNALFYTQATANTQIVGIEIAILVNSFIEKGLITADDVHIIGHSLGSHIAGYAGAKIVNLGRITGLDPAGPNFEKTHTSVRLDPSDAKFVDAIHTDAGVLLQLGLGIMHDVGHVDFWPNGGKDQPKCPKTSQKLLGAIFNFLGADFDGIEDAVACSHMSAVHFYTDSILKKDCSYSAYKCSNFNDFKNAKCMSCSARGCNHMGHWASPSNELGSLYFTTQDATALPYCYSHYKITAVSSASQGFTQAVVTVQLKGAEKSTSRFEIANHDANIASGSVIEKVAESTSVVGPIRSATVSFTHHSCPILCILFQDKWSFKYIEVVDGQSQTVTKLCPTKSVIQSGTSVEFNVC